MVNPRRHAIEHAPIVLDDDAPTPSAVPEPLDDAPPENDFAYAPVRSAQPVRRIARAAPPAHTPRRIVLIALLAALLGLSAWGVTVLRDPATLPLKTVRVEGAFTHVSKQELQQAVTDAVSGGFLTVNVAAIRAAAQRLPWVRDASVRRVWPDALRVNVTEQIPVANWGGQGLVNADGEIFTPPAASFPPNLPELRGPQGSAPAVLAQYRAMDKTLAPLGLRIARLELDERRAWRATLDNGMELMLGRADAYARLLRFAQVYHGLLAAQAPRVARVDLRYSNGLAVRWKTVASNE